MSKQSRSKSKRETKRENHDRLSADVKNLYEASGHYGPWSSDDRVAAFGVVEVERTSEPDRSEDLQDLAAVMDLTMVAFDAADQGLVPGHVSAPRRDIRASHGLGRLQPNH